MTNDNIASDRLEGAAAIAAFLGTSTRRVQYLLEKKAIPAGRIGKRWIASKTRLRAHYDRVTGGEVV